LEKVEATVAQCIRMGVVNGVIMREEKVLKLNQQG